MESPEELVSLLEGIFRCSFGVGGRGWCDFTLFFFTVCIESGAHTCKLLKRPASTGYVKKLREESRNQQKQKLTDDTTAVRSFCQTVELILRHSLKGACHSLMKLIKLPRRAMYLLGGRLLLDS